MKTKLQTLYISFGILIVGLFAPFLPTILYGHIYGATSEKLSTLSPEQISNRFHDAFPFLILALFSIVLLYTPKPASLRLRRLCGIVATFVVIFIATFDLDTPVSLTNYDIGGPGMGFWGFILIPPLYVAGYFLGWLWEMIHGVKDDVTESGPEKK